VPAFFILSRTTGDTLHQKGFTLIELMVVIAIIGILASIAIPQFISYRVKSFNTIASADLKNIMSSEELYYANNQTYIDLTTVEGYQDTLTNLAGIRLSINICAKVIDATSIDFTVQTEHFHGDKSYSNAQSSSLTTTDKSTGTYAIGC